ncbi:MAG: rod shape-determining protein MreC [Steroidobacteraceae bacterium]
MAAFARRANRPLPVRGPSAGARLTLYSILSVTLMIIDQRSGWLETARYALTAAAYPIQLAVNSPGAAWRWLRETFEARDQLQEQNASLRQRVRDLDLKVMRYEALASENARWREIDRAAVNIADRHLAAQVKSFESTSLRQRMVIDRGEIDGAFRGQTVIAGRGVVGQILHVGPVSSEVILISDPEHAIPVQVLRNGLRSIAVGTGAASEIVLQALPIQADIREDDLLVCSGLGGVFPAGFPVARVTDVSRDVAQSLTQVRARPLAGLDRDRQVMLIWLRNDVRDEKSAGETGDTTTTAAAADGDAPAGDRP